MLGIGGERYAGGARTVDIHVSRLRSKLGGELPLLAVRRVGSEAVDGLGRKRYESALPQDAGRPGDAGSVGGEPLARSARGRP